MELNFLLNSELLFPQLEWGLLQVGADNDDFMEETIDNIYNYMYNHGFAPTSWYIHTITDKNSD